MRHVGGEALDRVDAPVERLGHVAERAGQMADLVGAIGEIWDFGAGLHAVAHALRGRREPPRGDKSKTPSTARRRCTGTATETTSSPLSVTRTMGTEVPVKADATSG